MRESRETEKLEFRENFQFQKFFFSEVQGLNFSSMSEEWFYLSYSIPQFLRLITIKFSPGYGSFCGRTQEKFLEKNSKMLFRKLWFIEIFAKILMKLFSTNESTSKPLKIGKCSFWNFFSQNFNFYSCCNSFSYENGELICWDHENCLQIKFHIGIYTNTIKTSKKQKKYVSGTGFFEFW